MTQTTLSRRRLLASVAATALTALAPRGLFAQAARNAAAPGAPLPPRGEFVIRGATVLTMDPAVPDLAAGDVHVRDGAIIAVAQKIEAPAAHVIDGAGMICIPGFVDTHLHLWTSAIPPVRPRRRSGARLLPGDCPPRSADGARGQLSLRPSRRRRRARRRRHHGAQLGAQHAQPRARRRRAVGACATWASAAVSPTARRSASPTTRRWISQASRAIKTRLDAGQGQSAHARHLLAQSRRA